MPKFKVMMTAIETSTTVIEVEAADSVEAEDIAFGVYEQLDVPKEWEYGDSAIDITVMGEIK